MFRINVLKKKNPGVLKFELDSACKITKLFRDALAGNCQIVLMRALAKKKHNLRG